MKLTIEESSYHDDFSHYIIGGSPFRGLFPGLDRTGWFLYYHIDKYKYDRRERHGRFYPR